MLETMLAEDFCIGGEQSGHIIFRDFMPTGDGQLSGIQLLSLLKLFRKPLSEAAGLMKTYPRPSLTSARRRKGRRRSRRTRGCRRRIERQNGRLGGDGRGARARVGTEPLIRIMVEGQDIGEIEAIAREIADVIKG